MQPVLFSGLIFDFHQVKGKTSSNHRIRMVLLMQRKVGVHTSPITATFSHPGTSILKSTHKKVHL